MLFRSVSQSRYGPEGLVGIVTRQLVDYYTRKEFGDTPKTEGLSIPTHKPRRPKSVEVDLKIIAKQALQTEQEAA